VSDKVVVVVVVQAKSLTWLYLRGRLWIEGKRIEDQESGFSFPHPVSFFPRQKLDLLN
jgi:hypothetical protein